MIAVVEPETKGDQDNPETKVSLNIRNITLGTRRKFKVWCAERGLKMENVAVTLLEMLLDGAIPEAEVKKLELLSDN